MKSVILRSVCFVFICVFYSGAGYAEEAEKKFPLDISGSYKSLFTQSQSTVTDENFFGLVQRVRLKARSELSEQWQVVVNYDLESIVNDFRNTPDFANIRNKSQDQLSLWDAEHILHDADHHYMKHSLYRAYVSYYSPEFRAKIGKQKIDWGRTRFWSPLDLFNPVNPLDVEYSERVGADAINAEYTFEDFSTLAVVYAFGPNQDLTSYGLRYSKTLNTTDVFGIVGQFKQDEVLGLGFDGQLGDFGVRGEATVTHSQSDSDYFRSVIGAEYSFANTLSFLGEYFYNGGADTTNFLANSTNFQYTSRVLTRNKHLLGMTMNYEITPLLKTQNLIIYDFEDQSFYYNPELVYNVKANLDVTAGSQLSWGSANSEFGSNQHLYYLQLQFYF